MKNKKTTYQLALLSLFISSKIIPTSCSGEDEQCTFEFYCEKHNTIGAIDITEYQEMFLAAEQAADSSFDELVPFLLMYIKIGNVDYFKQARSIAKWINVQDKHGNTPLHLAVLNNASEEIITYLKDNGADATILNNSNETPEQLRKNSTLQPEYTRTPS